MVACIAACILFLPSPISMLVTSVYQVPQCTAQFACRFGIRSNNAEVKKYVMESIQVGMTLDEVMKTLGQFGEVSIGNYVPYPLDGNGVIGQAVVEIPGETLASIWALQMEFYGPPKTHIRN